MIEHDECILIMGRRKCGKSHLGLGLQKMWPRRVIIDSLREYEGDQTVDSFDKFCDAMRKYKEEGTKNFVLVFRFPLGTVENLQIFDQIMRLCYQFGNILIVIEEAHKYSSTHQLTPWLSEAVFTGRHRKLGIMFISQRPGMINKSIFSQCAHIFIGALVEGNDLNYVSRFLRQDAQKLVSLPERRFIYFNNGKISEISNDI